MAIKWQILSVLVDNIERNKSPDLVASTVIAERLNLELAEIMASIRSMSATGLIESDEEARYVLITRQGMHVLRETRYLSPFR
jgi:predicted transcriptional regulator